MHVYLGSDQYGYDCKAKVKDYLEIEGYNVIDLGVFNIEEQADYPDIAREVGEKIAENGHDGTMGVLIDATGIGMMMAANKVPGVRATVATSEEMARMAREANDANIVCVGTKVVENTTAVEIVNVFLNTQFAHDADQERCLDKMEGCDDSDQEGKL